jgi:hypothetical protein
MAKLDRLGWAAGLQFVSHGVRIGIRANTAEFPEEVTRCLPPHWEPASTPVVDHLFSLRLGGDAQRAGTRHFNLLYSGPARVSRTLNREELWETLESHLQFVVAALAERWLFVHAGVVGWQGRAIVLPGLSYSGKSTLTAALLRAGATYYSDEFAVLDAEGRAHPFPRPLSLRQGAEERPLRLSPEALGSSPGEQPLPVGLVVLSEYREGARWRPRKLSPGQGLLALLANTVQARRLPEMALRTLRQVVAEAPAFKGTRGEAEGAAGAILRAAERP